MISTFLSNEIAYAICMTLIHSVWQISIIAIILGTILRLNKKAGNSTKYILSLAALAVSIIISLSTFSIYYLAVSGAPESLGSIYLSPMAETSSSQSSWLPLNTDFVSRYLYAIVNAWIIGSVLFFLHFSGGFLYLKYIIRKSDIENSRLNKSLKKLNKKFKIYRTIVIKESGMIKSPLVMGYLKPIILFPLGLVNMLSTSEVECILAHELGHIKRHDYIFKLIQSFAEIIFYYHPGIWYISSQISYTRELCCDDLAIEYTGNSMSYAKTLVKLQEMKNKKMSPALSFSDNKSQFTNRILRLLDMPVSSSNFRQKLLAFLLIFSAVFVFAKGGEKDEKLKAEIPDIYIIEDCPEDIKDVGLYLDTIPEKNSFHIRKHTDKEELELEMENGNITKLKINGDDIPENEFENYKDIIIELRPDKDRHAITVFPGCEKEFGNIFFHDLHKDEIIKMDSMLKKMDKKRFFFPDNEFHDFQMAQSFEDFNKAWVDSLRHGIEQEISSHNFLMREHQIDSILELLPKGIKRLHKLFPDDNSIALLFDKKAKQNQLFSDEENELILRFAPDRIGRINDEYRALEEMREHKDILRYGPKSHLNFFEKSSRTASDIIAESLLNDELVAAGEKTNVELSGKHMKINGEKQPSNIWKKYKRIYEEETGLELSKKSKIEFEISPKSKRESYIRKLI